MTINIFVLKGDLNGKIVVVRFFFVGYIIVAFPQPVIWREGLTITIFFLKKYTRQIGLAIRI